MLLADMSSTQSTGVLRVKGGPWASSTRPATGCSCLDTWPACRSGPYLDFVACSVTYTGEAPNSVRQDGDVARRPLVSRIGEHVCNQPLVQAKVEGGPHKAMGLMHNRLPPTPAATQAPD